MKVKEEREKVVLKLNIQKTKIMPSGPISSVQFSLSVMSDTMNCSMPGLPVCHQLLEFTQTHVHWVMMPSNHLILCCPLLLLPSIFPASGSFPKSQLFTSGGQSIGTSALPLVLPENIQGWFPLGLTGLISLLSKGLSRLFSSTTIWKHSFFGAQPSLRSNSQILSFSVTQDECGGRKRTHIVSGRAVQGEL